MDKLRFSTGSPIARRRFCKKWRQCWMHSRPISRFKILGSERTQSSRVNQVVANQPEFAAAFKCAIGTPMNPTKRCAVW
ncbi:hypothetical protein COOONC_04956 [Cooperia oncophora]